MVFESSWRDTSLVRPAKAFAGMDLDDGEGGGEGEIKLG